MLLSARRQISYPNPDRSDRPDVPLHIGNIIAALDVDVIYNQGLDSARIAAAHQVNGGRVWYSTDTGILWYDTGTTWVQITAAVSSVFGRTGAVVKQVGDYAVGDVTGAAPLASPALTGTPTAPTPVAADVGTKIATKAYVDAAMPPGIIAPYASSIAPAGWLLCNGAAVSRTTYAALFAVLNADGLRYGAGDGSTTFNVPDMRGRVPVGKAAAGTFLNMGATGGEETHVMIQGEMPAHNHTISSDSAGTPSGAVTVNGSGTLTTGTESADHTHSGTTNPGGPSGNTATFVQDYVPSTGAEPQNLAASIAFNASHSHGFSTGGRSAAHTHDLASHAHTASFAGNALATHTHTIGNTGGGAAHNNLQPYIVTNYIIKT